jgi:hypothetical protein
LINDDSGNASQEYVDGVPSKQAVLCDYSSICDCVLGGSQEHQSTDHRRNSDNNAKHRNQCENYLDCRVSAW